MNNIKHSVQSGYDLFENFYTRTLDVLPGIVGFLLYLIIAFAIYKIVVFLTSRVLRGIKIENVSQKYFPGMTNWKIKVRPSGVILALVKLTLILVLVVLGSEIVGLKSISKELSNLLNYIPRVVASLALLLLGLYASSSISKTLFTLLDSLNLSGSRLISRIAGFLVLFIISLIAIELLGIDTSIITNNLSIILGSFMICVAIAIGLGSVEIVKRILFGFYFKKNFKLGQEIRFEDLSGKIVRMDNISIVLQQDGSTVVVPITDLVDTRIQIINTPHA